jgi:uncharacterized protein (DUF488 family)
MCVLDDGGLLNFVADVLTIGHSTHSWDRFAALLHRTGATAIADVRSAPYSRHAPQFNRTELSARLTEEGLAYVFLGRELGGRPRDPSLFTSGIADYEKMAATQSFKMGLARVTEGVQRYRVCLMCSEGDPLDCHRCLLVARWLQDRGMSVGHILADGSIETHRVIENRLLAMARMADDDLFISPKDRLTAAYREQGRKVAYAETEPGLKSQVLMT